LSQAGVKRKRLSVDENQPEKKRKTSPDSETSVPKFDGLQPGETLQDFETRIGNQTREALRAIHKEIPKPDTRKRQKQKEHFRKLKERRLTRKKGVKQKFNQLKDSQQGSESSINSTDKNDVDEAEEHHSQENSEEKEDISQEEENQKLVDHVSFGEVVLQPPDLRRVTPKLEKLQMKLGKPTKHNDFKNVSPKQATDYQLLQQQVREAYRIAKEKKVATKMSPLF